MSENPWVRRYFPAPDAPGRLVCLPHAGGSAVFFRPMARTLAPAIDVLAVQYPGRQDRRAEPFALSMGELADAVTEQLRPWLDRPTTLFGHSMGATLAFEVARRLEGSEQPVHCLLASGRRAPSCVRREQLHLGDDAGLIAELKRLSGTDTTIFDDDEVLRMILPAVRMDYRIAETYRYAPGPPISCPIVVLTGDDDPHVTLAEAEAWADHTKSEMDLRVFTGGHFFLVRHADAVMAVIAERVTGLSTRPLAIRNPPERWR